MNNRELKFRIWDKWNKQWDRMKGLRNLGSVEIWNHSDNGYVCQQSTGLKDKNDKEIYEGDILKERHFEDWGDEEGFEYVGVVRYRTYSNDAGNQFSGFVTYPNLRENKGYAGNPIKVDCEVIGNIFENPELLK